MPTSIATREAAHAELVETTTAMLAERLPEFEARGRVSFSDLWEDVRHLSGILGRNEFYGLLENLDGAHLPGSGLLVRVGHRSRATRRIVIVRVPRDWDAQRAYLDRYVRRGRVHPPLPVSYATAHARVRDERGPASAHGCEECGERAAEWSFAGLSPDAQAGFVTVSGEGAVLRAWSPVPADYQPLCRMCHAEFDELGIVWEASAPPSLRPPTAPAVPLPDSTPAWVRR